MTPRSPRRNLALAAALLVALPLVARAADRDGDGLDDDLEDALLERFAPVVLLHPTEPVRPSSAEWLLARADLEPAPGPGARVMQASILGALSSLVVPPAIEDPTARIRPFHGALGGSADPRDWEVYGHALPAPRGGVILQYWFFYPFNDAFWAFDHEGDWEHVTVRLDATLRPEGAYYARHLDSHPGVWFAWSALSREGDHPVVLAGRGTHASYATLHDAPFWERTCATLDPARAAGGGCTVWRTWSVEGGGVQNMGERSFPRVGFLDWPGRWGSTGAFGSDSRTGAPPGPAFQAGWCIGAAAGACR